MTEKLIDRTVPDVELNIVSEEDSEFNIPEYALLRFAKFLLPRMQEDFEKEDNQKLAG